MKKSLVIFIALLALATSRAATAATIDLGVGAGGVAGDHILGEVFTTNDIGGGLLDRDEAAIDALRVLAPGTRTGSAPEYYRSTTVFGSLPDATQTGALSATPGQFTFDGTKIVITLSSAFQYLVVSYDG